MDMETHMADRDFETDRGSGAIITAFAVLAIAAAVVTPVARQECICPSSSERPRRLNCHGQPSVRRGGDAKSRFALRPAQAGARGEGGVIAGLPG